MSSPAQDLYLKKYISGAILVIAAFACAYLVTTEAIDSTWQIVEKMQSGNGLTDINALLEIAAKQKTEDNHYLSDIPITLFTVFWLIGIIDSYRVGRNQGRNRQNLPDNKN